MIQVYPPTPPGVERVEHRVTNLIPKLQHPDLEAAALQQPGHRSLPTARPAGPDVSNLSYRIMIPLDKPGQGRASDKAGKLPGLLGVARQ
jgi:hypothetical protein